MQRPTLLRGRRNETLRLYRRLTGDHDTIDMEEAAILLGKSTKTLKRWRDFNYGPPFQVENRYVSYSRTEVEGWKADNDFHRTPSALLRKP